MSTSQVIQSEKVAAFVANLAVTSIKFPKQIIEKAGTVLANIDFPTTRSEAWKYTRVAKIANLNLINSEANNIAITNNTLTFVFEDGNFISGSDNLPNGLTFKTLSACKENELAKIGTLLPLEGEIFSSINTLYAQDGFFIHIAANAQINEEIEIIHQLTGENKLSNFRNLIVVEKNAKAAISFRYPETNATSSMVNVVSEIFVGENANFSIDKLQNESEGNFHIETDQVVQENNSNFSINTITLGGSFVRNNLNIDVAGTNCETHLNGAYVLSGQQHVDNHTCVDHKVAHCVSNEMYKGVIGDKATAVFNGKVFVRKDAQKVNAFQSNANVLLSDNATVNSKPELEIYADDVKCSHGSTTGQMDEQAVFYLRARGLSEKSAKQLMVSAFIEDALANIKSEPLLEEVHSVLQQKFGWN